ncbi:hypothetical protein OAG1_08220 [Agarivorans sp. OAG1]|nr:hypothetical protein OAG1_08220 [Agarivorans sp. OAG1]
MAKLTADVFIVDEVHLSKDSKHLLKLTKCNLLLGMCCTIEHDLLDIVGVAFRILTIFPVTTLYIQ